MPVPLRARVVRKNPTPATGIVTVYGLAKSRPDPPRPPRGTEPPPASTELTENCVSVQVTRPDRFPASNIAAINTPPGRRDRDKRSRLRQGNRPLAVGIARQNGCERMLQRLKRFPFGEGALWTLFALFGVGGSTSGEPDAVTFAGLCALAAIGVRATRRGNDAA